ncbi:MAG TPA: VOC family protein [Gammaproteobacteria bacterium]|nr:VOC family protein [Gammaproteobacteria bacterium]
MRVLFISFPAANYASSKRFYEQAVGLVVLREHEGAPHRFTDYDVGGTVLKLYEWTKPFHGSGHSGLFIATDDLEGAVERVRRFGAKATDIDIMSWGGRCASVTDPFGNIFDLIDAQQVGDG